MSIWKWDYGALSLYSECSTSALVSGLSDNASSFFQSFILMLFFSTLCFVVSTLSQNYSQVDKLWSITPFLYAWLAAKDGRTTFMAILATIWGIRLTWNFNRRGGYTFPRFWLGEEDYRWQPLRKGEVPYFEFCKYKVPWMIFNLTFISFYQHLLLWLIAAPALVSGPNASCGGEVRPPNKFDSFLFILFLFFVVIETLADNEQWNFQQLKRKFIDSKDVLAGDFADGFNQNGLYAIVRKPNYAAEQTIWIIFYLFSVNATGAVFNWSFAGCFLLCTLFQASGWMTEKLSVRKYPKYVEYQKRVGLYFPKLWGGAKRRKKDE